MAAVTVKDSKPKKAAPMKDPAKKRAPRMLSNASHPKYSEMILQAVANIKGQGKMNASRPDILKFVTATYNLDPAAASRHINLNLKKMLESGHLKPAAAAGRKGAGSYRLGQAVNATKETKAAKKTTAAKGTKNAEETKAAKGTKPDEGTKAVKGTKPKSKKVAVGKGKTGGSAKVKKAPKTVKPKK